MVKFITIAKTKEVNERYENIINVVMMKLDIYYEIRSFEGEDKKIKEICKAPRIDIYQSTRQEEKA